MQNNYRLIAIDLDDTLLNDELNISDENLEAIKMAVDSGLKVTIATGRPYVSAKRILSGLNIEIPIITFNGAMIVNLKDDTVLYEELLPIPTARKIIKYGRKHDVHINMFIDNNWLVEDVNRYSEYYHTLFGYPPTVVNDLTSHLSKPVAKLILSSEPEIVKHLDQKLRPIFKDEASVFISKPLFLEFVSKNTNKGRALLKLGRLLNIKPQEIVAIGDSYNDISMFECAGLAVAVANANDYVKEKADFITKPNTENGVAYTIKQLLGASS